MRPTPRAGINWEAESAKKAQRIGGLLFLLERCRTVLGNMALENEGKTRFLRRWKISDEPLRNDAKNLLPLIDRELES